MKKETLFFIIQTMFRLFVSFRLKQNLKKNIFYFLSLFSFK